MCGRNFCMQTFIKAADRRGFLAFMFKMFRISKNKNQEIEKVIKILGRNTISKKRKEEI